MGYWKKGQRFQGLDPVTGMLISGKILGRAGKVTGVNKDCYNVQLDNDGWTGWFNLATLRELSEVNENIEMIILFSNDAVSLAKNKEIQTWIDNKVFEVVPNEGQRAISVRWIVTEKTKDNGLVIKARLVARGFEEDTTSLRKDSPTCSKESVRLLVAFASSKQWACNTVDVKSAYLQGDKIERDIPKTTTRI
ncbi:unnamed protein product [Meganyctiphanes norvegica]|uniref:Reverse transcriptase Ty1/copia-type domain-containing protein n=1 Tax=Meganyctiphanes norvegica TaxID=48144 RepID=A0AAV2RPK0_MEGNR